MRALVVASLMVLVAATPADAEVMKMIITPEHELRIGGILILHGVLVGNREDLVRLGQARVLVHKNCESLLLRDDQAPSAGSILAPMTLMPGYQLAHGRVLLELPSIIVSLPLPSVANNAVSSRLEYEWRSMPPPLSPPQPPSPGAQPAMSLNDAEGCRLEEACVATDGNLTGKVKCGEVSFGISTEGKAELGAGPITLSVGAR